MSIKNHKFVILDELQEQLEVVQNGVKPESFTQSIITGIQNTPSSLVQRSANTSSNLFTTFQLSPQARTINCLDSSFIDLEFDVSFSIITGANAGANETIPMWFGFRDTSSCINQIQLLIENSAIWTTTYHHEESVLVMNALPESEIAGNNQYASIDKMKRGLESSMQLCYFPLVSGSSTHNQTVHFKITVDVSRLDPIISNMHFVSTHYGNLKLKLFFNNLIQSLFFCPAYNLINAAAAFAANTNIKTSDGLYWSFYPFSKFYSGQLIQTTTMPVYIYNTNAHTFTLYNNTITFRDTAGVDFLRFNEANMCQCNLDMYDDEYNAFSQYIESQGSIIIPTQTFSTNLFNNSTINANVNDTLNTGFTATVNGYNLNSLHVWLHPRSSNCYFINPRLSNYQLILDGRPLNPVPYNNIGGRAFTDNVQAIIDIDHDEINHDFIRSMSYGLEFNGASTLGANIQNGYIMNMSSVHSVAASNNGAVANPATLSYNFATNYPDAFHSGACTLEFSNKQAMVRLTGSINNATSTQYPYEITLKDESCDIGLSAFCDCCIILNYDSTREKCFSGSMSWANPVK